MECLTHCYRYKIKYNINFWGSRKASGYVFADDKDEARSILENKYGKVDYSDIKNSTVVGFEINETDIIED